MLLLLHGDFRRGYGIQGSIFGRLFTDRVENFLRGSADPECHPCVEHPPDQPSEQRNHFD